jgi:hypothetical protein
MRIDLLTSPGCPHAAAARETVTDCLTTLGMDVAIVERVGRYRAPTVLVDGVDELRHEAGASIGDVCRLDLPTPQRVLRALPRPALLDSRAGGRAGAGYRHNDPDGRRRPRYERRPLRRHRRRHPVGLRSANR